VISYECNFTYEGYSLTAYYIIVDNELFVEEIWLGDNPITELVKDNVYYQAVEAAEQNERDRAEYNKQIQIEMRYTE